MDSFDLADMDAVALAMKLDECKNLLRLERVNQLRNFLKTLGYELDSHKAYNSFLSNRCDFKRFPDEMCQFSIDDKVVAQWFETCQTILGPKDVSFIVGQAEETFEI